MTERRGPSFAYSAPLPSFPSQTSPPHIGSLAILHQKGVHARRSLSAFPFGLSYVSLLFLYPPSPDAAPSNTRSKQQRLSLH